MVPEVSTAFPSITRSSVRVKPVIHALIEGNYRISELKLELSSQGGALEVRGDISFQGKANYNAALILGGSRKQTVSVTNDSYFKTIIIRNSSKDGICVNSPLSYGSLINESGCPVTYFGQEGITGFTLTEDLVIEGNAPLRSVLHHKGSDIRRFRIQARPLNIYCRLPQSPYKHSEPAEYTNLPLIHIHNSN